MGGSVLPPLFDLKPKYGGGYEDNGDLLQKLMKSAMISLETYPPFYASLCFPFHSPISQHVLIAVGNTWGG